MDREKDGQMIGQHDGRINRKKKKKMSTMGQETFFCPDFFGSELYLNQLPDSFPEWVFLLFFLCMFGL